ncbi:CBL-interacting serine/threonine-protein kinase 3 [Senna tora]|uniref:non-specific serine/threonine protein kinase n=1 Tax=Senna tora TaxID=362788 RepID=A0A834T5L9_9FABA|nr:CBL-interacting serine/threonine-protein kinase 3 [Senna tora]
MLTSSVPTNAALVSLNRSSLPFLPSSPSSTNSTTPKPTRTSSRPSASLLMTAMSALSVRSMSSLPAATSTKCLDILDDKCHVPSFSIVDSRQGPPHRQLRLRALGEVTRLVPKIKRRVGKYEVGRTIGEGTFAKVRFARNSETGDPVALKILDKEKVLRHKMAEQVMGSKTKIYIVLEYVTGGELFDKIVNHGRMGESEARRYFQQLINAVDYCHSRGVYHRDLKPENLLLDVNGNLKVSDFGLSALSQQVRDDGLLHTTCGTPNYVAPEVLDDQGYDGATADLWSCGVILFVLLAGYLPFDDSNLMNLYKKISAAEFTCPPWLSFSARKLITQILDPNPMTRITIPEILEDEWFKKDYKPPIFDEKLETNLDDVEAVFKDSEEHHVTEKKEEQPTAMNAFELISMSKGLNLENLFDPEQGYKRETRFTSTRPANEIISKIEEAAKPLGFDVQKKNYKMKLENVKAGRKGNLNVATEVFQVAPSLHMVEVRKAKGDTLEFHKFYKTLSTRLEDVVWKTEDDMLETK